MQNWISENTPWLITLLGSVGITFAKNQYDINGLKKTVYNQESGDLRLVRAADCENCRLQCQKAVEKSNEKIEKKLDLLINLHLESKE